MKGRREKRREEGREEKEKGKRKEEKKEEKGAALSMGRSPMPRNHPDPPKALVEWQRPAASAPLRGLCSPARPLLPRGLYFLAASPAPRCRSPDPKA